MPETINSSEKFRRHPEKDFHQRFTLINNVENLCNIKSDTELCIIQTDFTPSNLNDIKKYKEKNSNIEVWISTYDLSRENILAANKIGIKTVICSPINEDTVKEFFKNKDSQYVNEENSINYNYLEVKDSKVMIVDDNLMNIELLEEILSKFDLKISSFSKPKDAYQAILNENFDLFLLDVMMPEMSGFELAKKIKETPQNQNVPILFISALSDTRSKMKGYNLGSFAYIEKPFDVNMIKSQIFNILKNRKTHELLSQDKDIFFATVAHDLKTPIRAGINALNLLLNENLGSIEGDQQEIIEDILYSTNFMKDMVDNILCKNKIESNQMHLSKQVYSLKELVENCIELTKYILSAKKQKIKFKCSTKNVLLPFDFLEMKRALHNVIANASQYSPEGSPIMINITQSGDKMCLSVQDLGNGIDLKNQEDVFLQYVSFAKKYKTVGSGLGLYITKKIVEAHGGEITLDSKVGYGTTVNILLPLYSKD